MYWFYTAISLVTLFILPLYPNQTDEWVLYVVWLYTVFLLPFFLSQVKKIVTRAGVRILFFLLFLLSGLFSTFFSIDSSRSISQLLLYASFFSVFTISGFLFSDLKSKKHVAFVVIFVSFVLSSLSLLNVFVFQYRSLWASFLFVYFGHNHLSALLLFSIPPCLYFVFEKKKSLQGALFLFCLAFLITALIFTFGRASMISLAASLALAVVVFRLIPRKVSYFFIILALLFSVVLFNTSSGIAKKFGVSKYGIDNPGRPTHWKEAIENSKKNILFGNGLDTFRILDLQYDNNLTFKTYYAHNFFLQMLSDAGVFGFVSSIGLIGSVLWYSFRKVGYIKDRHEKLFMSMFLVGMVASTLNSLVDFDWQLPTIFFIFWLIAGLF